MLWKNLWPPINCDMAEFQGNAVGWGVDDLNNDQRSEKLKMNTMGRLFTIEGKLAESGCKSEIVSSSVIL